MRRSLVDSLCDGTRRYVDLASKAEAVIPILAKHSPRRRRTARSREPPWLEDERSWSLLEHDLPLKSGAQFVWHGDEVVGIRRPQGLDYRRSAKAELAIDAGAVERFAREAHTGLLR